MAAKGGQIGNNNATKSKPFAEAIERALKLRSKTDQADALLKVAEALINQAQAGDLAAIKELADRTDGKASQSVAVTGSMTVTHEQWLQSLN
jgi:hypothetical protein